MWHSQAGNLGRGLEGRTALAVGEIYVKLAVAFSDDPKVRALARYGQDAGLARDLFVQMICHCKRMLTDGLVQEEQIGLLVYPLDPEHGKQLAKQLASVGLIAEEANGYRVLAYVRRNGTRADVEALSAKRAEAGQRGGLVSRPPRAPAAKTAGRRAAKANAKQVASDGFDFASASGSKTKPYTETDTETEVPTTSGADEPRQADQLNIGHVVAAFAEGATAAGLDAPSASIKARVGRQARELLAEHKPIDALIESARRMGAGEWNDLAVQYRKDNASANGASRSEYRPYTNPPDPSDYEARY
jgi:hypothetical protein